MTFKKENGPPPLILTTGEPAGIGPDLVIQLSDYLCEQPVVLCGDITLLRQRAELHKKEVFFHRVGERASHRQSIPVAHISLSAAVTPGQLCTDNANYVLNTLTFAAENTLNKNYSGIVTAPIHKGIICELGKHFSGHTEFFAEKTHTDMPVMVLGTQSLKVGLVTTHLPLKDVSSAITTQRLFDILQVVDNDMHQYFTNGKTPRIGVCGLNPHAGEDGHLGREEREIIDPALDTLRRQGMNVSKALPADTLFVPHHACQYDIIVAMYHDQGLPVVKAQGFGACVNMTFGLPIVRTSVDHGTALDLAGTNKADPNSLQCAIEMAKQMANISD